MKNLKSFLVAIVAMMAIAMPAQAQFRFGVKAGLDVNSVSVKDLDTNFSKDNRTGYSFGLTTEFTAPLIGLGFDLSVMYVHRNTPLDVTADPNDQLVELLSDENYRKQDFIEVPLNLKYKISLPAVGELVAPYVTTGPSIAFKCSKEAAVAAYEARAFDAAWNVGGGVQLLKHFQVGVNYSFGLTNTIEDKAGIHPVNIKNNGWKISAAYFF